MSDEEMSPGGSHIYRHQEPVGEPEIAHGDEALIDAVSAHVEQHIGTVEDVFHEVISPTVHLDVLRVPPGDGRPHHTLVTCGMAARPMQAPDPGLAYAELTLALPPDWPVRQEDWEDERQYWPFRLLKFLGRVPHEYATWLGEAHTIPNDDPPRPYAPGTALSGAMLGPPLLPPADFRVLERPEGPINFYAVIPLHAA